MRGRSAHLREVQQCNRMQVACMAEELGERQLQHLEVVGRQAAA